MSVSEFIMQKNTENLTPMKNKIKIFRAMHNLTQEHLADAIGVNQADYSCYREGEVCTVSGSRL